MDDRIWKTMINMDLRSGMDIDIAEEKETYSSRRSQRIDDM